jgi:DNA-binding FadR family transcriptional regulator
MTELVQSDLDFHVAPTRAPGNPVLAEIGEKLLFPLFALASGQGPDAWFGDLRFTVWCCT